MKRSPDLDTLAERPNLDFRGGVRGKYAGLLEDGSNVAIIDVDLLESFPGSLAVNEALRLLKDVAGRSSRPSPLHAKVPAATR